ncbi:hypothetical protein BGZ47_000595 [Haplosporangium gracile]|nr:hypothetical protein BGZ47_000595 [Haplosporangium gracile]
MNIFRNSFSRTPKRPTTTTDTRRTPSPLDIPEILELIFLHLDEHTLRYRVVYVCRQWHRLNQGRLLRSVVWDSSWSKERLYTMSAKLVGAARFSYYLLSKPDEGLQGWEIKDAIERAQEEYRRLDEHRSNRSGSGSESMVINELGQTATTASATTTATATAPSPSLTTTAMTALTAVLYNFGPLKELNLALDMSFSQYAAQGFPYPDTLTKLVMTILVPDQGFIVLGLSSLLQNRCPLLEILEIHGTPEVELVWTLPATTVDRDQEQQHQSWQQPLALQSLILDNTTFDQGSLENLLTFASKLKVLKLIAVPSSNNDQGYDWLRLLRHLQSLPIVLETIHISTHNQQTLPEVFQAMSEICTSSSIVSEWNLWVLDTSSSLLKDLELHTGTNSLTTLELFSKARRPGTSYHLSELRGAPLFLHQLLSSTDKLVHLKTLKTIVRLEDWDIYRRGGYFLLDNPNITESNNDKNGNSNKFYGNNNIDMYTTTAAATLYMSEPTRSPPVIWRCRWLQTLHIEVYAPNEFMSKAPVQSRIIFGYVSRVFPQLEELRVHTPHFCQNIRIAHDLSCPKIRLELEGGLCLLGRLRHLQRLDVRPGNHASWTLNNVKDVDLDWMLPSGHYFKSKWSRRNEVKQWQKRREHEKKLEADQKETVVSGSRVISDVSAGTEVLDQLRNLGLLKDVKEMVKEMESMSVLPLPSLEGLSLRHPYFVWPENEIKYSLTS